MKHFVWRSLLALCCALPAEAFSAMQYERWGHIPLSKPLGSHQEELNRAQDGCFGKPKVRNHEAYCSEYYKLSSGGGRAETPKKQEPSSSDSVGTFQRVATLEVFFRNSREYRGRDFIILEAEANNGNPAFLMLEGRGGVKLSHNRHIRVKTPRMTRDPNGCYRVTWRARGSDGPSYVTFTDRSSAEELLDWLKEKKEGACTNVPSCGGSRQYTSTSSGDGVVSERYVGR